MKPLSILILALPLSVSAQVYKCETADGVEFTDRPCAGAEVVELEANSSGLGRDRWELQQALAYLDNKKSQRAQRQYRETNRSRRDHELAIPGNEIGVLWARKADAKDNLAGATYVAGLDSQIAALRKAHADVINTRGDQIMQIEMEARRNGPDK
jgi:hypothetical protein